MTIETLVEEQPREWLIRKGGYYYRPNRSGYTGSKAEAGRYTAAEAHQEALIEPWHMSAIHQDEIPDPVNHNIRTLLDALSEARAELEAITETLKYCEGCWSEERGVMIDKIQLERSCATAAEAELARLREALAPFAIKLIESYRDVSDYEPFRSYFSVGHIRAAARALTKEQGNG